MPRLKKPPPRNPCLDAAHAPAVKGRMTRSSTAALPAAAGNAKNALNDLSNLQQLTNPKTRAANQPVRRSTRILALQQKFGNDSQSERIRSMTTTTAATRSRGGAVPALSRSVMAEPRLRRSARVRAQNGDALLCLETLTVPNTESSRQTSARNGGKMSLTRDDEGDARTNRRKRSTENAADESTFKRYKASDKSPRDDCSDETSYGSGFQDCPSVDRRNIGNVLEVPEYAAEIYQHLFAIELRFSANPYTDTHLYLDGTQRFDVIDLLVKLSKALRCEPPVLHLAVQILDRYVSGVPVHASELDVVGVVTLMLASKYDEVEALTVPEIWEVVSHFDRSKTSLPFDFSDFIDTETLILKQLDYGLSGPTSWSFLQRFLTVTNPRSNTKELAHYLLECSLYIEDLLDYRPSAVSAAVVCLAIRNPLAEMFSDVEEMQDTLLAYTQFELSLIIEIAEILAGNIRVPSAAREKELKRLGEKEHLEITDDTKGYAAWIKFSRREHKNVSLRFPPPKAWHLYPDYSSEVSSEYGDDSKLEQAPAHSISGREKSRTSQ